MLHTSKHSHVHVRPNELWRSECGCQRKDQPKATGGTKASFVVMCSHVSLPKTGTWYVRKRKRNMSENSSSTHRCPLLSEEIDKNLSCQEKRCKNRKNQARQKLFQMEAKICAANATQNKGHTHTRCEQNKCLANDPSRLLGHGHVHVRCETTRSTAI